MLEIILIEPQTVPSIADELEWGQVASAAVRVILRKCFDLSNVGVVPSFERLILEFDDPRLKNMLVELDETARAKQSADLSIRLKDVLVRFQRREEDRERSAAVATLLEGGNPEDKLSVLKQLLEQQKNRHGISAPTDG